MEGVFRHAEQSLPHWARLTFDTPPSAATQDEEDGGQSLPRAKSRGRYSGRERCEDFFNRPSKGLLKKPDAGSAARRFMRRRRDGFVGTGLRACPALRGCPSSGQARRPVPTANNLEGRTGLFQQTPQGGSEKNSSTSRKRCSNHHPSHTKKPGEFSGSPGRTAFSPASSTPRRSPL